MYQQLSFRLQALSPQGRAWDMEISESLFGDAGFGEVDAPGSLCKGVQWRGSVVPQDGLFRLQGAWSTELIRHCLRCNAEFALHVEGDCSRYFRLGPESDSDADSVECDAVAPPGSLNLLDLLREELWLAWKPMVVCDKVCKGLCQQCGENLNRHECNCSQHDNNPFAALKNIRFNS